ncbi:IS5 family transposase [Couchioplanes caeruleus]|uniref:IS5 family transposase n=1 Tax=Couchioplanes caeruleus TaxID=56438 RepID=UPI00201BB3D1|nr:IS5 family transposase [Couchioplanes caeruleus]UQU62516.1 IS5 family transposase [Couchioplanes caeruleus]UQU62547.1 IS5 family transposase [Couchioplanes caeruleus]UQU66862.1 IS5 family transposase [Couchioplanes caeruleus]UQU66863.1 IS5 family transposase [Couchioplanes caeruleus]UQU66867.1 IS5 family transposase [Couchioplanes caeruleus]
MSSRRGYPSDLTDAQWDLVKGLLPEPSGDGRPEKHPRREIVNAILYLVRSGCPWRYLPADLPPWQTVYWYFVRWEEAGVTESLLTVLRVKARVAQGRAAEPSAGVLDSQSVKGADTVGRDSRGYDAGKKINGRKRFIVTDTAGLLITACVLAASWQDRDGGKTALLGLYLTSPVRHVFADSGFAGRFVDWAADRLRTTVEIVRKPADQRGFAVQPRRWVVERTLAWLTAHRRLARDYERDPAVSEALIRWAAINGMLRRITRGHPSRRQSRRALTRI